MPSIKMKTKSAASCLREKHALHVCQKSTMISKNSLSCARFSQQVADLETCVHNAWDLPFCNKTFAQNGGENEANHHELLGVEFLQGQKQIASLTDSTLGSTPLTCPSNLDTIFSPILESIEMKNEQNVHNDDENKDLDMPCQVNDNNKNNNPSEKENCNVSDFYVSDMIVSSFPMESNIVDDGVTEASWSPDYKCEEPSIFFDVNEEYMFLPLLEDTLDIGCQDGRTYEETITNTDDSNLYLAIHQWRSSNQQSEFNTYQDLDQAECFDPRTFIRNFPELPENYLPDLPDMASNFPPALLSKESRKSKAITLVLDLDETLVHSTLDHCDDADFSFPVFFNMKEHTVYVKKRPHLQQFLERVAEMFEIVVFTASQSIYAKQLLDILDPDGKLISRRAYRESCIFADGSYTKDLTVLGVDLAKVVIIDNSPQVFQLQVNNGIPIKSWFDDPSDCALISLFPFLETLVDVDDVRPFIAKRFVNKDS